VSDRILSSTNVPAPFRNTLLEDYDVDYPRARRSAFRQVDEWEPSDTKPALLLEGAPNRAKTMLAAGLLNEYHRWFSAPVKGKALTQLKQERLPVYFIQLAEFIDLHLRTFRLHDQVMKSLVPPNEYLEIDQLLQDLKVRVKVLVIDDVGKEHHTPTGFAEDAFDLLVRTRHNNGLTTIYTSNMPVAQWGSTYSDSMASIIKRSSTIVTFD
jgi:DNA replication protein DnaC